METKAIVQAIEFSDVRGNKLLYLKMQANGKEVLVNIGQKTYDSVNELCKPRETSTTLNVLPPETKDALNDALKKTGMDEKNIREKHTQNT